MSRVPHLEGRTVAFASGGNWCYRLYESVEKMVASGARSGSLGHARHPLLCRCSPGQVSEGRSEGWPLIINIVQSDARFPLSNGPRTLAPIEQDLLFIRQRRSAECDKPYWSRRSQLRDDHEATHHLRLLHRYRCLENANLCVRFRTQKVVTPTIDSCPASASTQILVIR